MAIRYTLLFRGRPVLEGVVLRVCYDYLYERGVIPPECAGSRGYQIKRCES